MESAACRHLEELQRQRCLLQSPLYSNLSGSAQVGNWRLCALVVDCSWGCNIMIMAVTLIRHAAQQHSRGLGIMYQ